MYRWTALVSAAVLVDLAASTTASVSSYDINDPMFGTCRLKGVAPSSANFKLYASLPNKDVGLNEACGRCITVKRGELTTSAYVLNVCDGCDSETVQLSRDALAALEIRPGGKKVRVTYEFDTCPSSLLSGDIKACLMEGASGTYVPLQFYNSHKVITAASINGVPATTTKANFLFSANPSFPSKTWYQNVDFSVTSDTGETLNSSLAFDSDSGCATSSVQFYSASTADGVDGNTSTSGSSSSGAIIGAVCGGIAALFLVVGSAIFVRRRKQASKDMDDPENEMENQFLSPAVKPLKAAPSTSYQDDRQTLASPTVDYAESFSPAANSKATNTKPGTMNSPLLMPAATAAAPAPVVAAPVAAKPLVARGQMPAAPASCPPGRSTSPSKAAPTTFAFSSNLDSSSRHPPVKTAPTLSAPVVHHQPLRTGFYGDDVEENRSSFDIDDMRETEARATSIDYPNRLDTEPSLAPFSAAEPCVNTVTSPQSNHRATSLRRPGSKLNAAKLSGRGDSGRYVNDLAVSNTDSYAPEAPRQTNGSIISNGANVASNRAEPSPSPDASALSAGPSYSTDTNTMTDSPVRDSYASRATQQNADLSTSQRSLGSMRESGGYSTDSLNILGYPYSKKSGRHHNSTG